MRNSRTHLAGLSRSRAGNIQTVVGSVTVEPIGSSVFQGHPGDAICFGDEIATGANSAVIVALKEGTLVRLSANTCVTLNEPACGLRGVATVTLSPPLARALRSNNTATLGNATEIAGGALKSVRKRPRLGLRMLSLAVLAYTLLRDIERAGALTTDDDAITPRDSNYGSFEITTKSGTVIVVDDPGLTYVVDDDGSVERRVNSSSRMEELQLAQQALLGTLERGFAGAPGSSTPFENQVAPDSRPLTIPINFQTLDPIPERFLPVFAPVVVDKPVFVTPPPPPQPIPPVITTFTFDSGIDGDRITNNPNLVLIGTGTPGTVVTIYDGGTPIGSTTANANGTWSFNTGPLPDGEHVFTAAAGAPTETAAARSAFSASAALAVAPVENNGPTSAPYIVVIDTKAPAAPVISFVSDEPGDKPTQDATPTLTIAAEAGSTVHVYLNGVLVGTAEESDVAGIFTFTPEALADGCYSFTATATDVASNTSAVSCEFKIEIDGTAPLAPAFVELADHSCCANDNLTSDDTPKLVIAAEAGSTVHVYRDGEFVGTAVETRTPGIFTFTSPALADGSHTFTATATDAADNLSPLSDGFKIAVITADPNDFDELAIGDSVAVGPDGTIHGTPKDDSIWFKSDYCAPGRTIYAGAGDDCVSGTNQDDTIYAGSGGDRIFGNNGNDAIFGGFGSDKINGGKGNDIIVGGYGADCLTGGRGNDTFIFLSEYDSPSCQRDTISDFDSCRDRIDLSAIDANASQIGDQAFNFAGQTNAFSVSAHSVTWYYDRHSDRTYILADTDGATDTAEIEIVLAGKVNLTQDNFVL